MKKKTIAFLFIFLFSAAISFADTPPPCGCKHKADSVSTETKKIEEVDLKDSVKCDKEEVKEEKNIAMMSLNLMYYIISKFLSSPSFQE